MNSVWNLIMPKKQEILGGIGFTDLCSHLGIDFSTSTDGKLHLVVRKDDFKKN